MAWHSRYLSALQARDLSEQSVKVIIDNYTAIADRVALQEPRVRTVGKSAMLERSPLPLRRGSTPDCQTVPARDSSDLAEAQRARVTLEARAKEMSLELEALRSASRADQRRIRELSAERVGLSKRVRDRDEELREKTKLLHDVHNETVALTIQFNMTEEQNAKLRGENKELVDRWMTRMGQEADAMNDASNFR